VNYLQQSCNVPSRSHYPGKSLNYELYIKPANNPAASSGALP
jgi:hypothetical protein